MAISLIRPQTENTKPPRALWVPFELGRPFGPPSDPQFQKRVILAALRLLERSKGPVVIEDFPDDDPRERPDPAWRPPLARARLGEAPADTIANALGKEIGGLDKAYHNFVSAAWAQLGRAQRPVGAGSRPLHRHLVARRGAEQSEPRDVGAPDPAVRGRRRQSLLLRGRLGGRRQAVEPAARRLVLERHRRRRGAFCLRKAHLASPDERLKAIAGLFLVPGVRVPPAG